jgi:serine-aspartate repeat-containing protein C/D/E
MGAPNNLNTTVNVCEDTDKSFSILDLLIAAGYTPPGPVVISMIQVRNPDGTLSEAPTSLVSISADGKSMIVTASNEQDWYGYLETLSLVIESGNEVFTVKVGVTVDPVNDAPEGADQAITLTDAAGYVLKEADFGFTDVVEGNGFKSVVISSVPGAGQLLLNGVVLQAGAEVSITDIRAGALVYQPPAGGTGLISFGFQVRDDGGIVGCNASDLDATANLITFQLPLLGRIGDQVWIDTDRDGVQDTGEGGVAGITVTLTGAGTDGVFGTGDDITRTTTTNATGNYLFDGLAAGQYQVAFGGLAGHQFTSPNVGSDAQDSDANANGLSQIITLAAGETNLTVDAGLVTQLPVDTNTAQLGDRVWYDTDRDGVQDSTETGAAGVTVTLAGAGADGVFGTGDDISRTTTTNATGNYLFTGLAAGNYQVTFGNVAGYGLTTANVGSDATDSDAIIGTGKSQVVALAIAETNLTVDAGLVQIDTNTAQLGDRVWYDTDRDGVQDTIETGAAGVTVTLAGAGADGVFGTGDDISRTTTTNATGNYLFTGLAAGNYQVTFGGKTGYALTTANVGSDATDSDAIVGTGKSQVVTLAIAETNLTVDAGLVQLETNTASLGDRVWIDANSNGVQDTGEASVAGVTVRLLNASGQVIATQLTDANGNYLFTGLAAGQYAVQVVAPSGYKFTTANAGTNDAADSDTVWDGTGTQTGTTGLVTLQIGESNRTVDAGVKVCLVKIGDKVWLDADADGVQDAGEAGVAGVTMTLTGTGADGVFGTQDDTVRTTTTDASGNYLFSDVAWGQYKVGMTMPNGLALTSANVGSNDAADSDFVATTTAGANLVANGSFQNGSTGWTGLGDTIEVGAATSYGVTGASGSHVVEVDANAAGNGTGLYQDIYTQANRVYELSVDVAARSGTALATNTVEVWWGNNRVATIDPTSTALKTYTFSVVGSGGAVRLSFREQAGDDSTLGGIIDNVRLTAPSTTYTSNVTVASCDDNLTVDAGVVDTKTGKLGDRVWIDSDRDGVQDSNEVGVTGVAVTLAGAGTDGVFGTGDDISRSTTTDSNGNYLFTGLAAGQYQVTFGGKTGYQFTTANVGSDATDSDANANTGKSQVVTLGYGETNLTVDAGLRDSLTGAIGDRVWHDDPANASGSYSAGYANGIQDTSEPYGLAGVRVYLYKSDTSSGGGTLVGSMVTDSSGYYRFNNLAAGWYQVEFDKGGLRNTSSPISPNQSLDSWVWTAKDQGTNDQKDSDVTAGITAKVRTDVFYLSEGQVDLTRDAGLTPIVIDLNGDGIETIARGASDATFDLFGNGSPIKSGWLSSEDGFLAVDRDGNGKIDDIHELFGGTAKGAGFAKLASFDSNGDGVVDAQDADFAKLLVWQDLNGDHQSDAGELMTLAQAGVASLTVGYTEQPYLDAQGNLHLERSNASMADGSSVDMTDVYFNVDAADAVAAGLVLPSMSELLGVDNALLDQALGGGAREQAAIADVGFDASTEAQRAIAAAMQQADAHLALAV